MRSAEPPRLATRLLQQLASGAKRESLIGDLIEQYRNGRSAAWFWRQALIVIGWSLSRELWTHKLMGIRAILTGWMALLVLSVLTGNVPPAAGSGIPNVFRLWDAFRLVAPQVCP